MSEDVITGMIASQPGKFSLTTDDVIALKQAGVSDKILAAMIGRTAAAPRISSIRSATLPAQGTAYVADGFRTSHVVDVDRAKYLAGIWTHGSSAGTINATETGNQIDGTTTASSVSTSIPVYRTYEHYAIEDQQFLFIAEERLRWRWSKPARLIVNNSVRFLTEGRKLTLVDEDGKEHQTMIIRQVLKPRNAASDSASQ